MTAKGTPGDTQRTRILLVEDHDDTRQMMLRVLQHQGYTVEVASGFAEAMAKGGAWAFDVLVADLHLGDGSGWDLVRRLRDGRAFAAIAVSARAFRADVERSRAAGYCEHLAKPIRFDELLDAITRCREQQHAA